MNDLYNKIKDPNEALRLFGIEPQVSDIQIPFAPESQPQEQIRNEQPIFTTEEEEVSLNPETNSSTITDTVTSLSSQNSPPSKEQSVLDQYRQLIKERESKIGESRDIDNRNKMLDNMNKSFSQIGNAIANRSGRIKVDQVPTTDLTSQFEKQSLGDTSRNVEQLMNEYKMIQDDQNRKLAADRAAKDDKYRQDMLDLQREKLSNAEKLAKMKLDAKTKTGESSIFEKEQNKALGKQSAQYFATDRDQLISNSDKVTSAIDLINQAPSGAVSGSMRGLLPDSIRAATNPEALIVQQSIQSAITDTLRPTLGAQFTEKEGERIMNLQYDPRLPPEENKRRAQELKSVIDRKVQATDALYDHLGKGGKLSDFNFDKYGMRASGETPTSSISTNEVRRQTKDGRTAIFDNETKQFIRYE